jgi:hypothetical protein
MITCNDLTELIVRPKNEKRTLIDYHPQLHKLNIFACSSRLIFLASQATILIYRTNDLEYEDNTTVIKPIRQIQCDDELNHIRLIPIDNVYSVLLVVGEEGVVRTYRVDESDDSLTECVYGLIEPDGTWSVGANRKYLVAGSNTHKLTVWSISSNYMSAPSADQVYEIPWNHDHNVPCLELHPTKDLVASVSIDSTVRLWQLGKTTSDCAYLLSWKIPHARQERRMTTGRYDSDEDSDSPQLEWGWSVRWYLDIKKNSKKVSLQQISDVVRFISNADSLERQRMLGNSQTSTPMTVESYRHVPIFQREQQPITYPDKHDFLIVTSQYHIYLLNSRLELYDHLYYCPRRLARFLPGFVMSGFTRLSLLEVVPEFSCFLVASQTDNKVLLVRILNHEEKYTMKPECIIPNDHPLTDSVQSYPVSSFHVQLLPRRDGFSLRVMYLDGGCRVFQVKSALNDYGNGRFVLSDVIV